MKKIRLILVDDHKIVQHGIGQSLEMEADMEVVARADTGRAAVLMAAQHKPEVMVMDISMPEMNGMEATRQILAADPTIKILALSMHREKIYVMGMLNAGAAGYVLKSCAYTELLEGIKTILSGQIFLSPEIAPLVVNQPVSPDETETNRHSPLSTREREVLQLLAEGRTSREIAERLGISFKTVDIHRSNLKKKLDIRSIAGLTKFALSQGVTSPRY